MSYLNKARLSTYGNKLKEWISSQESKTITSSIYPWTKTAKAGAVSCYPVGGTELKPTVDFLFTETGPASGDKGPENPSTITGVSSVKVTRCGKNLCPMIGVPSNSSVSVSFSSDGEFVFNGTTTGITFVTVFIDANVSIPDYLEIGKTYTFSLYGDESSVVFAFFRYYTTNYGGAIFTIAPGQSYTQTIPNTKGLLLRFQIPANTVLSNAKFKLQIEEGSSATDFEPYAGNDYTIPLGDTYYGGSLDLATGVMMVTRLGIELDGTEDWGNFRSLSGAPGTYRAQISIPQGRNISNIGFVCTHYAAMRSVSNGVGGEGILVAKTPDLVLFTNLTSLNALKAWLASQKTNGTPVCVSWNVPQPYTVQLAPTQILSLAQTDKYTPRLNTIYTDASAVQVGYVKSPIREEYELQQAIVSQGGNI